MTALAFIAQSVGWAVIGFLVGFFAGRAARDVHRIADAVTTEDTTTETDEPKPPDQPPRRRWRPLNGQTIVAVVVVLLGIVTVVQGLIQSAATERLTQCQVDYSNQFADALEARSQASADAQNALDELMTTVGEVMQTRPVDGGAIVQRAITDYLAKRAAVKTEQQAHPYPEPPREACP